MTDRHAVRHRPRSTSTEDMFKSAKGQKESDERLEKVGEEIERQYALYLRYGRWRYVNRRAPKTFLLALSTATAGVGAAAGATHFAAGAMVGVCIAWGFVIGCLCGGWPKIAKPKPTPQRGHGSRSGEAMVGYMLVHHMLRHALSHKPRRSLGR